MIYLQENRFLLTEKFKELEDFFIENNCSEYVEKLKNYCIKYDKNVANWDYFFASKIVVVVFTDYSTEICHLS